MIDDFANGVRSARARILAHRVDAGSLRWTVIVLDAFDLKDRLGSLTSTATAADISARAHAYHGAYRICRQNPTFRWFRARMYDQTRILTLVAETGEFVRTVAIFPTFGPDFRLAIDVWITGEARWTTTYRQVIEDSAFRTGRARIVVHARINALHVNAGVIAWTIAIAVAADDTAPIQRIAIVAFAAAAIGYVIIREAFAVDACAWMIRD